MLSKTFHAFQGNEIRFRKAEKEGHGYTEQENKKGKLTFVTLFSPQKA